MTYFEKKLRRQLRELGYHLKASPSQRGGIIDIGSDCGLYQISDGNHVVAGWRFDLTLEGVEDWISERERDDKQMISGGDCE